MSQPDQRAGAYYGQPASYPSYSSPGYGSSAAPSHGGATTAPPPSNAGWAVAAVLFFWPLAFSAFNHLHRIYPLWAMGDHAGAQEAADRVKSLGKTALGIAVALFVGFIVLYAVVIVSVLNTVGQYR